MGKRLLDALEGREENYILPFFWQRGEEENILRDEMARIYQSGIRAVCLEARPHPDFLGPKWWQDIDVIMDEARTREMRVWILDDDHFPTGRAAGRLENAPKELRRSFLSERHIDALGPAPYASFIIDIFNVPRFSENGGSKLIAVVAYKRDSKSGELIGEAAELTTLIKDGILHWSVPEGYWRIFIISESDKGGSKQQEDYLNPLVAESTRVLIDTIYEAFYERYSSDFGTTLAGFFSDEPGFYNDSNPYDFESKLGKKNVELPWSKDVPHRLKETLGEDYLLHLPLLWHDQGKVSPPIRFHYMDIVSRLYAENFSRQLGDWCREHSVEYIGHVIEDNNAHTRLGAGSGHFFRSLWGQDMSGIDVVLWQLSPGFDEIPFKWAAGEADSEFFNYGLGKMASSLAHLDPKKKGRTMAEVFGAYGWAEGLKLMKWLTDHMLVRGVNHFVPHSFSAKEFPDADCPPHLYARGKNPQFRYYRYLNMYTNRLSHLLSGGTHVASVAVLYHADAEWSGDAMYFHKPVKALMKRQIDCDVLPVDAILESVSVDNNQLLSQDETFCCLIIPFSEALSTRCLYRLTDLAEQGLPIFFIDALPVRSSEGNDANDILGRLASFTNINVVPLDELADRLIALGFYEIKTVTEHPYLRHYHVQHADSDVYFFFNEHPQHSINTIVKLPKSGSFCTYDAYDNKITSLFQTSEGEDVQVPLQLAPFETITVVAGLFVGELESCGMSQSVYRETVIPESWSLSVATSERYPNFEPYGRIVKLVDLSRSEGLQRFSGTFLYETLLEWSGAVATVVSLDLGEVYETAEVKVNGQSAGVRISFPYRFEITNLLMEGTNMLAIEVTNTLVKNQRDFLSIVAQQEPSGLLGPVKLISC